MGERHKTSKYELELDHLNLRWIGQNVPQLKNNADTQTKVTIGAKENLEIRLRLLQVRLDTNLLHSRQDQNL